jgi:hypothetical protein
MSVGGRIGGDGIAYAYEQLVYFDRQLGHDARIMDERDIRVLMRGLINNNTTIKLEYFYSAEATIIPSFFRSMSSGSTIWGVSGEGTGIGDYGPIIWA